MSIFVDTSAFYSLFDRNDTNHAAASHIWRQLLAENASLVTTNYVIVETTALVQHRLGMVAAQDFHDAVVPLFVVEWVNEQIHRAGVAALLTAHRRQFSLVDCVSFEVCRRLAVQQVFAFDNHFVEQGFTLLAPP